MKLRLRENSIRLRLLQSEIKQLRETGLVSEEIRFNQARVLIYTLKVSDKAKEISARFSANEIRIEIPQTVAAGWTQTDRVGLSHEQFIDENLSLKILLEKDFICLERPADADNADAFPHPKMQC